jgi:predicted MFS family arabinose efflux permease
VAVWAGWRAGFGLTLPLFLVVGVALSRYVPAGDAPGSADVGTALRNTVGVLRARDVLLVTAVMTALFFVYQGLTGMLVAYLVQGKGLGDATAATVFGLFFVGGIGFQVLAGALGDRFGPKRALTAIAAASAVTAGALPFVGGLLPVTAVVVLMSVQLGVWPLAFSYATGALPTEVQAGGLGLQRTIYLLLASPASAVVGAMGDRGLFDAAFLGLAAVAAVAAVICLLLPRQRGEQSGESTA